MSDRTRLTRKPERGTDDPAVLHRLLDEARIAHVGFVRDGSPVVLPMAMGRDEDRLLLHGSTAPACSSLRGPESRCRSR